MENKQSYMPKHIAEEALKEYSEIEELFNENQDKSIAEQYEIFRHYFFVFHYDGEQFDVMPNRVAATIAECNGKAFLLSHFDIDVSDNENEIQWRCDYTVEELQDIIKGE